VGAISTRESGPASELNFADTAGDKGAVHSAAAWESKWLLTISPACSNAKAASGHRRSISASANERGKLSLSGFDGADAAERFVDERWQRFALRGAALFASVAEVTDQSRAPRAEPRIAVAAAGLEVDDIAEITGVGSHNEGPPVEFDQFLEDARSTLSAESLRDRPAGLTCIPLKDLPEYLRSH
jgi:hypothetical protein